MERDRVVTGIGRDVLLRLREEIRRDLIPGVHRDTLVAPKPGAGLLVPADLLFLRQHRVCKADAHRRDHVAFPVRQADGQLPDDPVLVPHDVDVADLFLAGADRLRGIFDRIHLERRRVFLLRLEDEHDREVHVVVTAHHLGHVRVALGVRPGRGHVHIEEDRPGPRLREHLDQLRIIGAVPRERAEHVERFLIDLDDFDIAQRSPLFDRFLRCEVAERRFHEMERAARAEAREQRPERRNDQPSRGRAKPSRNGHAFPVPLCGTFM